VRTETVTILRAGTPATDRYGNSTPGADTRTDIPGCLVAPRLQGDATEGGRQGVIIGATVYLPPNSGILSTDRLEVRGVEHVIEGEPGWWNSAPGRWDTEVATRRVEG
jgi:hypothetical protein